MIKVTIELVHAAFAKLADLGMKKNTVCIVTDRKEFADRCVGCDADGFVILNGNN